MVQVANLRHVLVRAGEADLASKIGRGAGIFSRHSWIRPCGRVNSALRNKNRLFPRLYHSRGVPARGNAACIAGRG